MDHRFETFSLSILELNRYLQKIKELEMKQFGLKASHTMCLYYLGQHPEGLTATQLTELCKEDKAAVSRCLSQLSDRLRAAGRSQAVLPLALHAYRSGALRCKRHPDTHQRSALLRRARADGGKAPGFLWHSCNHQ